MHWLHDHGFGTHNEYRPAKVIAVPRFDSRQARGSACFRNLVAAGRRLALWR
jgi:hypothetical protein